MAQYTVKLNQLFDNCEKAFESKYPDCQAVNAIPFTTFASDSPWYPTASLSPATVDFFDFCGNKQLGLLQCYEQKKRCTEHSNRKKMKENEAQSARAESTHKWVN